MPQGPSKTAAIVFSVCFVRETRKKTVRFGGLLLSESCLFIWAFSWEEAQHPSSPNPAVLIGLLKQTCCSSRFFLQNTDHSLGTNLTGDENLTRSKR
jgi:hypothetical protein